MLKRSLKKKHHSRHFRLRVESCVDTILQLDKSLGKGKIRPDVIERFERLKESLVNVADEAIDEKVFEFTIPDGFGKPEIIPLKK